MPATVRPLGERRWAVETDVPVWAAAPGQAAVLYDGDEVLGGGRIERPLAIGSTTNERELVASSS